MSQSYNQKKEAKREIINNKGYYSVKKIFKNGG